MSRLRGEKPNSFQLHHGLASIPECHPHVAQDGTCNGLQHYAALARDYSGACAVNLVPLPAPQDVYTEVSKVGLCEL